MKYKKGERVQHPVKLNWGIGEVIADCADDILKVFFSHAGEKSISLSYVQPVKVFGDEAISVILDSLNFSDEPTTGKSRCKNCGNQTIFSDMTEVGRMNRGWCPPCYRQSQTKHTNSKTHQSNWEDESQTIDGPKGSYTPH
jgi:hypothetical protein